MKKIMPPKPGRKGDGQVKKMPEGPSKKVRDDYLKKIQEIKKKKDNQK